VFTVIRDRQITGNIHDETRETLNYYFRICSLFMVYLSAGTLSVPRLINLRDIRSVMNYEHSSLMMEAVRTSETSVDNHFTRQYNPEDSSEQL
jgi:hypothetical protein